ncbi:MAG TPA: isocitrate/isopropylmalate family dehydrogenase, partial [Clostridia bacterium]|nr:isocitrate/isopropylmalate family dehydrogenase [Clostridia bacterium]
TSVLLSPQGYYLYEAAHGTVTRHYYKHIAGEETSTNSVATIFAWSGALKKRAELDGIGELKSFGENLEKATLMTIDEGVLTKELAALTSLSNPRVVNTFDFLKEVAQRLNKIGGYDI